MHQLSDFDFHAVVGITRIEFRKFVDSYTQQVPHHCAMALSPTLDMLLCFLWLRQYLVDTLLAALFQVAQSTIRGGRQRALTWLYTTLRPEITLKTANWRRSHGQRLFDDLFTFVIDGSEQPIMASGNPFVDTAFYSAKKKQHSVTITMMASLSGKILYLSQSFPGSCNDDVMGWQTLNEWYVPLAYDEYGLGDSGYKGFPETTRVRVPPSKRQHHPIWHQFSSMRIIIEQLFRAIKIFRAAREEIRVGSRTTRQAILLQHQMVWTIAAALVNRYHKLTSESSNNCQQ